MGVRKRVLRKTLAWKRFLIFTKKHKGGDIIPFGGTKQSFLEDITWGNLNLGKLHNIQNEIFLKKGPSINERERFGKVGILVCLWAARSQKIFTFTFGAGKQ
ncbi:MAG: hypothetical protein CM15mV145_390 [uncultured marine virus]|nr:MAG: hypothetical protein CM15mV145_390 [uncultured marine virus]